MANNRDLSQFASFLEVDDTTKNIGIATTATPYVGIGTTNPTSKLHVIGDARITGVVTATTFVGALTGTATSTTNIPNLTGAITSNNTTTSLGSFTSAQLATALTDETGSGANVFAISPVLVTPSLGIATATSINVSGVVTATTFVGALTGTATSTTNIPNLTGAITSVNTTTSLGSFTSANLSAALTDETGSGSAVFATSPVLVTPSLGIATATSINASGIITATQLSTGASGTGVNITTNTISGPATLTIDPAAVGDNTGAVRIKGDLYVDGTQFIVNSTTIELADFNVGIATTVGTNALLDGAGIGIGSTSIRKTLTWSNSSTALKSSEDFDVASGKVYKINGTSVLSNNTLGSGVVTSSLTSVGTLGQLQVTGGSTFTNGPILVGTATSTGTTSQPLQVTGGAYVSGNLGIGTTNPTSKLDVVGDARITGVVTATTFIGALTGTATSTTNIPNLTGAITSVGTATTLGSFSSSNLATALTDETGSGSAVFATSPTLVTPVLGAASATSIVVSSGSTFTNGPILVGTATSTGTTSQPLQVTGGAYVSGNLGIGTTNPTSKLEVLGGPGGGAGQLRLRTSGDVGIANTTVFLRLNDVNGNAGYFGFGGTANQLDIWNYKNGDIKLGTNGTERVCITSTGNLGIGTTNPGATLNVVPTATSIAGLFSGTTSSDMVRITQLGTGNALVVEDSANPDSSPFVVTGIGSVGIGISTPLTKLDVRGVITAGSNASTQGTEILRGYYTNGALSVIGSEYSSGGLVLGYSVKPSTSALSAFFSSTDISISRGAYTIAGNEHKWYVGATQTVAENSSVTMSEVMRIDSSRNLLIGTTSATGTASQPLQVNGGAYVSGNLGVGTASPAFKADIAGDARVTSTNKMRFGGTAGTTNFYIQYNSTANSLDFVAG